MIIRFLLLVVTSILFHSSFAQKNYIPGQIITSTKDTLDGFIDYRNWGKNPDRVSFVETLGAQKTTYRPTDLVSFQVKNEIYVSAIVETETSPRDTKKLNSSPELKIRVDTTFLQTLVKGEKSLHFYKNNLGVECYYILQNHRFQLLEYKKYRKTSDSKVVVAENRRYVRQLSDYLNDCSPGTATIRGASYRAPGLIKIFQAYYDCSNFKPGYIAQKEKMQTEFGVVSGVSLTSLDFNSEGFDYLVKADFPTSTDFSGGLYFNLIMPRSQGKWSIYNELLYTSYSVEGTYRDEIRETYYIEHTSEIARSYLKLNNLVRYKYPVGGIFLYINVGISNGFAIYEKDHLFSETVRFTEVTSETGKPLEETRKYEQGLIGGLGIQMKRISIDVRYEKGNGISEYSNLGSPTKRYYFLLGYRF